MYFNSNHDWSLDKKNKEKVKQVTGGGKVKNPLPRQMATSSFQLKKPLDCFC